MPREGSGTGVLDSYYGFPIDVPATHIMDPHIMDQVKISPKFQVVIPKAVRESLGLKAGQRLQVVQYRDRIELVPMRDIREMRGWLAGIDTRVEREPDRPL